MNYILKKFYIFLILFLSIFVGFHFVLADELPKNDYIEYFYVSASIQPDGSIDITETINYYSVNQQHGIFRTVPLSHFNLENKKYLMSVSNISVLDANYQALPFVNTSKDDNFEIRIGDPNSVVQGNVVYNISYKLMGALTYFSDHDELYWNVTGNGWQVPIYNSSVLISIPSENPKMFDGICYTGPYGSTTSNCVVSNVSIPESPLKNKTLSMTSNTVLNPYEGLSVAVKFDKGIVEVLEPKLVNDNTWMTKIFIIAFITVFYFLIPFYLLFKFFKEYKKWKEEKNIVTAWFEPPKVSNRILTPSETGTLVDSKVDIKDISATIIHLAQRGFLTIEETDKKMSLLSSVPVYKFIKSNKSDKELLEFERSLLSLIFQSSTEITTKDIARKTDFYTKLSKIMRDVCEQLKSDGFFKDNIYDQRSIWLGLIIFSLLSANVILFIVGLLNYFNLKKTKIGAEAIAISKSLKNFLVSQEEQYTFQSKHKIMFEKLLPYAISFGVEKVWVSRFKNIVTTNPSWYKSSTVNNFNYVNFSNYFNKSFSQATTMSSTRSSTGHSSGFSGGFSGGGRGGGGGGSW